MTFLEFHQARMAVVAPDGDSRRLDSRHKAWVKSDLVTLQTYAPGYRSGNKSTFLTWTDECGASYVVHPYGLLSNAFVKDTESQCDSIQCTPVTELTMRSYQKRWSICGTASESGSGSSSGGGSSSSGGASFGVLGADALRLLTPEDYRTYPLLYLNTEGDGVGGWFVFMPDDSHADDGVDYIIPASITRPSTGTFVRSGSL